MENKNKQPWDVVMVEYRALEPMMKQMVRNTAVMEPQSWGVEEIGSSDVNCQIVDLYNSYGGFDNVIRHGLELVRDQRRAA